MKISIQTKCSDSFWMHEIDDDGKRVREYIGYAPPPFNRDGDSDYLNIVIDMETGKVVTPISPEALTAAFESKGNSESTTERLERLERCRKKLQEATTDENRAYFTRSIVDQEARLRRIGAL